MAENANIPPEKADLIVAVARQFERDHDDRRNDRIRELSAELELPEAVVADLFWAQSP